MIKHPWQIWTIYGLSALLVVPAMVWLSLTIWRLDQAREEERRQTEIARRDAELQERVSSALWRMDWLMIPLVAQEAARPYYMYRSFYTESAGNQPPAQVDDGGLRPSPLLTQPSDFIRLHFQIEPDGEVHSPQAPQGEQREQAIAMCSVPSATLDSNDARVAQLKRDIAYQAICAACPQAKLPAADPNVFPWQTAEIGAQVARSATHPKQELVANSADLAQAELAQQSEGVSPQAAARGSNAPAQISEQQSFRNRMRGNEEFLQRDKAVQSYAKGQMDLTRQQVDELLETDRLVSEGVMRPLWINDLLLLARRVELADRTVIQGCWLDWDKIKSALAGEVEDVLPGASLEPVRDEQRQVTGRRMATLPVQLVDVEKSLATIALPGLRSSGAAWSGLKLAVAVAWLGLFLGLIAIAILLRGVIRLSERRAAFASAVTHELRTPLTTFRMYAEMLAEGMVPTAEKQQQYARTMKVEADRLGHLVENVLRFARLERRAVATRKVPTTVAALFDRFAGRLKDRTEQAGMQLSLEFDHATREQTIATDPQTVEQIVFNLVDNACKYAASTPDKSIHVVVAAAPTSSAASPSSPYASLSITVRDHGPGIDPRMSKRLFTAFSKSDQDAAETAQGVGLGLSLCRRLATDLGGRLVWDRDFRGGASFTLTLPAADS